ncbi:MAG: hypothetical protein RL141_576 [Candidatus Parcubacteria bacterium]
MKKKNKNMRVRSREYSPASHNLFQQGLKKWNDVSMCMMLAALAIIVAVLLIWP